MIIERMALELGLKSAYVSSFASGASHAYKTYSIAKRDGSPRIIDHPSKQLKAFQRWLMEYAFAALPIHDAAMAYRKHRSIFDNASVHAKSDYLLRMDFKDFFPSIIDADFRAFAVAHSATLFAGWTNFDVETTSKLIFKHGRLTIGAPTSPLVSNFICFDMDARFYELSKSHGVVYSRYADDLFFSTSQKGVLKIIEEGAEALINALQFPEGLQLNKDKTRHSSRRHTRKVTGIILGSDKAPYIGRPLKRKIRSLIHKRDLLDHKSKMRLAGLLSYAVGFDPEFMNSLVMKYGPAAINAARYAGKNSSSK
jgi:RNA-directed DNA polymerase